jgi:hypothetical protein
MPRVPSEKAISHAKEIFIQVAGILMIIPLAPFICRFIPPLMFGDWNIDLFVALIIAIIFVRLLTWLVKPMVIPAFILFCGVLLFNVFSDNYTFSNVFNDYRTLVKQNWVVREQKQIDLVSINPDLFGDAKSKTSRALVAKVQYKDSVVRNFSVKHSLENFEEYSPKYGMTTRFLSLFKHINQNFKYVPDSRRDEYYATPKETILNGLGGDCDDHSILMASCLTSIGAQCRLVIIEGHMYPEMYVGNEKDFETFQQAIIQTFTKEKVERIFFHEYNGEYWINLDYTASHPGGPYLSDKVKLIINL